jgi:cytochrome c
MPGSGHCCRLQAEPFAVAQGIGDQYSPAVKNAGFVWDRTSFAAFIANPRGKIPGNKMVFAGIKNETEIANLWTYLSHFNVDGSSK